MADLDKLAKSLTKALLPGEMEAFRWLPINGHWSRKHPHDKLPEDYPRDGLFCLWANKSKLIEGQGLTTGFPRYRLTPLGLALRNHLKGQNDENG